MSDLADRLAVVRASIADAATRGRARGSRHHHHRGDEVPPGIARARTGRTSVCATSARTDTRRPRRRPRSSAGSVLRWHFVGQLQSKKARQVRAYATAIHSVDRAALVDALRSDEASVDCFVQVEPHRRSRPRGRVARRSRSARRTRARDAGPAACAASWRSHRWASLPGRHSPGCARSRSASRPSPRAPTSLSMGMSHDFREAILEGATHLRIGTAITGNRPVAG